MLFLNLCSRFNTEIPFKLRLHIKYGKNRAFDLELKHKIVWFFPSYTIFCTHHQTSTRLLQHNNQFQGCTLFILLFFTIQNSHIHATYRSLIVCIVLAFYYSNRYSQTERKPNIEKVVFSCLDSFFTKHFFLFTANEIRKKIKLE